MALHHTFLATCWRFSTCLRLGQIFEIEPAVGQCMAIARRHASLSFLDIDVLPLYMYMKGQWTLSAPLHGPPSHVCSHLLAVLTCLRLGQIFEIEPAVGQCMAIARRHASLSFLDIDVLPLYMYMEGQWTLSAPLHGPPSHFPSHLLAVLLPQIGSDF